MAEKQDLTLHLSQRDDNESLAGAQGRDFSGRDLMGISLEGQNFFESTFNGCLLNEVYVTQSIFQHTEFTEASITNCVFKDTSFDHADFVLANITNSEFVRCSFQNAEWRDSVFNNVKFRQCIFRNTTTSLIHFIGSSFDDASAASFVGTSKRFSVFSNTEFKLPLQYVEFLENNFGIKASTPYFDDNFESADPLFKLALFKYYGELPPDQLYKLTIRVLEQIISNKNSLDRLKLRYITDICRICLDEKLISVFAIQFLETKLSRVASQMPHTDQMLELLRLILTFRVELREIINLIEDEAAGFEDLPHSRLKMHFEFEKTFSNKTIEIFLEQMAKFSSLPSKDICIVGIKQGSTIVDVLVNSAAYIPDIFRFIKYSLSFATVTLTQAVRMKKAYQNLTAPKKLPAKNKKLPARSKTTKTRSRRESHSEIVAKEIAGVKTPKTEPVEIFVNIVKDKVLVVNGHVKVTISLTS